MDVFKPQTGEVVSDGADGIACWIIDTDYNEESFFVRHAYFLGANDLYNARRECDQVVLGRRQAQLVEEGAVSFNSRSDKTIVRDHFDVGVEMLLVSEEAHSVARNVQIVMECAALFDKPVDVADDIAESWDRLRVGNRDDLQRS